MDERERRPAGWDVTATAVSFIILGIVALMACYFTLLFPMGTPACSAGPDCPHPPLALAMALVWASAVVALAVGVIGAVLARARHRSMFPWPLVGTGIVIAATLFGLELMSV